MANAQGKSVDTTFLSVLGMAQERGFIHRDYLAHCLRYSHVAKSLMKGHHYKKAHVLDVGCGREVPLARMMFSMRMTHTSGSYTGVDYGPIPWPDTISEKTKKWKMKLFEKSDFTKVELTRKQFDVINSLEVLEHVEADHAFAMMKRMRSLLKKDGICFLSTPCYDPHVGAAANHVNEMTFEGFRALIHAAGFKVANVWGTFASQKDYKKLMSPAQWELFNELSAYYDSNVTACLMAPMFPQQSRNCIWRLVPGRVKKVDATELKYLRSKHAGGWTHGSSKHWGKHIKEIMS